MAELPSEAQLTATVSEILRTNDLEKITLRMVMKMLAERFSVPAEDLSPQKGFVKQIISDYLENSYEPAEETVQPPPSQANDKRPKRKSDGAPAGPLKPVRLTGLERAVVLAEPLANFLGEVVIPRSHIPKRISVYAKQHDLQDQSDRRRIICDEPLKAALNVDEFTFFTLAKLVSGLVYKPDECDEKLQELARECEEKFIAEKTRQRDEDIANGVEPKPRGRPAKKQKAKKAADPDRPKRPSPLLKPMQLSEALVAVCGESQLPRSEVLKKVWAYIKENQLKDPTDATRIRCDEKLRAVFEGSHTVSNMGINKYLSAHLTKIP